MKRRELLELVGATGVLVAGLARGDTPPPAHEHHDHAAMTGKYADLIAATTRCVNTGEACRAHCITLLGEGDKDLAACAKTVQDTLAACTALREMAAANSPFVPKLAALVADICTACETECRKHDKHQVCRDCGEACARCAKECQRVSAAA